MENFFKQTLKFLFNSLLVAGLFISAQQTANLSLGWSLVGYVLIFIVDLGVLLSICVAVAHHDGFIDGVELQEMINQTNDEINENIDRGKDEFTVKIPNKIIINTNFEDMVGGIGFSNIELNNIYEITSVSNEGTESEVTFTKKHQHSDEAKQLD